jgi:hypothetical protein
LLFHHVVHIPKYPLLELRWKHQWFNQSHVGIVHFVVDLWMWGFNKCHIQSKTHKHQLSFTIGHWNIGSLWKQKGFEVDGLIG